MRGSRLPAPLRELGGFLFEGDGIVDHQVNGCCREHYDRLLDSGLHVEAVRRGLLIPQEEVPAEAGGQDKQCDFACQPKV